MVSLGSYSAMEIRQVSKIWSWVNLHITKNVNVNSAE